MHSCGVGIIGTMSYPLGKFRQTPPHVITSQKLGENFVTRPAEFDVIHTESWQTNLNVLVKG